MSASVQPVTFLYEDAVLAVVDKPAGVPVVPAPGLAAGACLRDRVAAALGTRAWVVHRLDRDTSGVVVFARTPEAHRTLSLAFEHRDVRKRYVALTWGVPDPPAGVIDLALHEARKGRARPAAPGEPGARPATTGYRVARVWRDGARTAARVIANPETGRHHQIRVHLRAIGAPVLGDAIYGRAALAHLSAVPVPRLALHAEALDLPHPSGERRLVVEAPWPADLGALQAWLDAHWMAEALA